MDLRLLREPTRDSATLGVLFVDGVFTCWTLEDIGRDAGVKVAGKTAIPPGQYLVAITPSARFGRLMPQVMNVPGFEGIRIHAGNTIADTEGCILVGATRAPAFVGSSRVAFDSLFARLLAAPDPIHLSVEWVMRQPSPTTLARTPNTIV